MIYIHQPGTGGFDWDAFNTAHIARHGLQPLDVEEALANEPATIRSIVEVTGRDYAKAKSGDLRSERPPRPSVRG